VITIDVALYGSLAQLAGGKHIASMQVELPEEATKSDLYAKLKIEPDEVGFVFINAILCSMPGVQVELDRPLKEGDHLGIFSTTHMWPYQYRDGIAMTENLKQALDDRGAMHHSYRSNA
jgi:hypothetical protein